jgi:hypothetical protein
MLLSATTITFEGLPSLTGVFNQYQSQGVIFSDAIILTKNVSLMDTYPPHSGVNVIYDSPGGDIEADAFDEDWSSVSAYVTGGGAVTMTAHTSNGSVLTTGTDGANYIGKGSPNQLLTISADNIPLERV